MEVVEPAKHEKNFEMRVEPGHDMIILARAKDEKVESWKFPPKMNVKLEPLFWCVLFLDNHSIVKLVKFIKFKC